ncbi:MAG TPA: glycogen debranching protein GlgX [Casimicrobiaceae bacterium]
MDIPLSHQTGKTVSAGKWYPLGATLQDDGVNFALYSKHASEVYLLLFEAPQGTPTDVIRLDAQDKYIWHTFVHGLKAGQLYGYRVRGPFDPQHGHRFNEHKLLIDPYAKALTGKHMNTDNLLLGYVATSSERDLSFDERDSSDCVPKSIVIDDRFDWQGDTPMDASLEDLCIYEVHLKGFTAHRSAGVAKPGTYLGFIEKIPYLKALGITAIELLPIQEIYVEDFLLNKGLTNYWGYNTIGFFAPESSYSTAPSSGRQVTEFKTLVRELHKAGIELILDVVYNHSGEGSEMGPTLCFKGIDNPTYYCLTGDDQAPGRYYENYTGCGNSLDFGNSHVIRFVMDSLRYWVEVMHVDSFRFDLASVLGREDGVFRGSASFFDAIAQDPVLSRAKLIAEPWDTATYQVGNFPIDWSEWNGRFRDTVRKFGKGDGGQLQDLGWRLTGSADLYGDDGRSAYNSVNFVTCHDGFTLYDLVSYNQKHNEGNQEQNRDGSDDNNSWNCGVEGETADPAIIALRKQLIKNYACMLFFSLGTPMMLGGDECLRTQRGNNNAYCQDNELGWFDWERAGEHADTVRFFKNAIAFAKAHGVLRQRKFFEGKDLDDDSVADITWFGSDLDDPPWNDAEARTLCYRLDGGEGHPDRGSHDLFVIVHGGFQSKSVRIPPAREETRWFRVIDTSLGSDDDFLDSGREVLIDPSNAYLANPRSTIVLIGKHT